MLPFDVLLDRARRQQTAGPVTGALNASDRVLIIDSQVVPDNKHWLVPILTVEWLQSYGAGALPAAQLYKCDSRLVAPLNAFTPPPLGVIVDTAVTFDVVTRFKMLPIRVTLNEVISSPDGTHCYGIISAGNGMADPIELQEGFFFRFILNGLGVAAGGSTPPFPPGDAQACMFFDWAEEPTRAGSTTGAGEQDC